MAKVRKQLYLDSEQDAKLRDLAGRWGCSEAGVLRIALDRLNGDLELEEVDEVLTDEEVEALERELDEWARQHPEPLGLSDAVFQDREGR